MASPLRAQTATIYGALSNFDVVNETGEHGHGFEVEIEGLQAEDIYYTFSTERYGAPAVTSTPHSVVIRWASPYDPATGTFLQATAPHAAGTPFAGTCYQWYPATYDNAGCEHFGMSLVYSLAAVPLRTSYRWLVADPGQPGNLLPRAIVPVAAPVYSVPSPAHPGDPAVLAVDVDAPEPAESPARYGDAQWMKVFVTQLPREVVLDELMADNPIVPQNPGQLETEWSLLQAEPASGGDGTRGRHRNQGSLDPTTRSVVRRMEMYAYTGPYDPLTHEALCADGLCAAPSAGEVGDFLSAQMTAANVQADTLTVSKTGNGTVESSDKRISCGNKCVMPYAAGTPVTLTAKAASGSLFSGWTGACAAAAADSCTVTVSGQVVAQAIFITPTPVSGGGGGGTAGGGGGGNNPPPGATATLSVKTAGGKGLIASTSSTAISCGKTCSANLPANTSVTLAVTPEPGFTFVNWSGACTTTEPVCTVKVTGATSVQANFRK